LKGEDKRIHASGRIKIGIRYNNKVASGVTHCDLFFKRSTIVQPLLIPML